MTKRKQIYVESRDFDAANLEAFQRLHPQGENVVLAADVKAAFPRNYGALKVRFEGLEAFVSRLASSGDAADGRVRFEVPQV